MNAARVLLLAQHVGVCMYPLDSRWAGAVSVTVERESTKTKRSVPFPLKLKPVCLPNGGDSESTAHTPSVGDYYSIL